MKKKKSELLLERKKVKPTATRILVAQEFLRDTEAKSLQDIENALPNANNITIYRTIKTFLDNDIIHSVLLLNGQTKYALCEHEDNQHDVHPHFTCEICGETHCLDKTSINVEDFPSKYQINTISLSLSGKCPKCNAR